jgi:hypothetical protein
MTVPQVEGHSERRIDGSGISSVDWDDHRKSIPLRTARQGLRNPLSRAGR